MSNELKIKVKNGFYEGQSGILLGRIPGGNFFKVKLKEKGLTALHVNEFERIPNEKLLHNESIDGKPKRSKTK